MANRQFFSTAVTIAAVLLAGFLVLGARHAQEWSVRFATLPATDDALRDWLAGQPGVTGAEVTRDGDTVRLRYATPAWRQGPGVGEVLARIFHGFLLIFRCAVGQLLVVVGVSTLPPPPGEDHRCDTV